MTDNTNEAGAADAARAPLSLLSARYSNLEGSAAIGVTVEAGEVLLTEAGTPAEWAQLGDMEVAPFVAPIEPRRMTSLEFLDLFTEAEQLAVVTASMHSPQVNLWWTKLTMATFVDFGDPRLAGGLQALVVAGLLTAERAQEVLA